MTDYHLKMIPIDLDIDILRCFFEVAQTGSFTIAGKNIGLTQSGVSVKIKRLEERLDLQVFNRAGKKIFLTHEGEVLLDYSKRILSLHDEVVRQLAKPKACGKLRVGLIDYFIPEILPNLLNKFRKHYPNIHLEVRTDAGIHLVPMFEKGELDLVVMGKDAYNGPCRILTQEPLEWVIGSDSDISPKDKIINLVLMPSTCSFRKIAIEYLDRENINWEVLFTGTSISNIQAAVQAGMGLSVLPKGAIKEGIKKAPSQLNLPKLPMYSIALITEEDKKNDARDVFVNYLEAELSRLK